MENANGNNVNEATNGGGNYLMLLLPPEVVSTRQVGGELLKRAEYKAKLNSFDWGHVSQWAATLFREIYRNFGNSNFVADEVVMGAGVTVAKKYGEMTVGQFGDFVGRWINGAYGTTAPNQPTINQTLNVYAFDVLQKSNAKKETTNNAARVRVMLSEMDLQRKLTNHEAESITRNGYELKTDKCPLNVNLNTIHMKKATGRATLNEIFLLAFRCPGTLAEDTWQQLATIWQSNQQWPKRWADYYNGLQKTEEGTAKQIPGTTITATKEKTA